jgi:hypothetical protein
MLRETGFEDGPSADEMLFRACLGVTGLSSLATEIEARLQVEGTRNEAPAPIS